MTSPKKKLDGRCIQKDGIPWRPIVSNWGSACHPLSCFLVEIINPLTGKSLSYVKNSAHFVERISDAPIHSNQMVSLDVVSLFIKVPTDKTFAVVRDKLAADPLLFTMEKEQDNKLPFLDVLVTCTEQGFRLSVYRKTTFTRQYLNFNSHHPYMMKKGIVCCLQHRAKTISSDTDAYQEEMISLRHNLHRNNYPEHIGSKKPR